MLDARHKASPELQVGIIGSLGVRRNAAVVPILAGLLGGGDASVARAAAIALGVIRSPEATQALSGATPADASARSAAIDATLACAESLLSEGKKIEALAIYKKYTAEDQPKHVRLAATRGMLACAGQAE